MKEIVADVAVEFRVPPARVREWSWDDFLAVLDAYGRRAANAKNGG